MKNFTIGQPLELSKVNKDQFPKAVITYKNGEALKYANIEDTVKQGSKGLVTSGAVFDYIRKNSVLGGGGGSTTIISGGGHWSKTGDIIYTTVADSNVHIGGNTNLESYQSRWLSITSENTGLGSASSINLNGFAPLTGSYMGEILFRNQASGTLTKRSARIAGKNDGAVNGGGLAFEVVPNVSITGALQTAMVINNNGKVAIGGFDTALDLLHLKTVGNMGLRLETTTEGAGAFAVVRFWSPVATVATEQGYLGFDDENNQFIWDSYGGKNWLFNGVGEVRVPNLRITTTPTNGENYEILLREPTFGTVYKAVIGANMTLASGVLNSKGNVDYFGTPVANQIAFWYDEDTIQGDAKLTYSANKLQVDALTGTAFSWMAGKEVVTITTTAGDALSHSVENNATSGASSAFFNAHVDPVSTGDPYIKFGIIGTRYYALGIDNTDDLLKLTTLNLSTITPSTASPLLTVDSSGNFVMATSASLSVGQFKFSGSTIDFLDDLDSHLIKTADTFTFQTGASTRLVVGNAGVTVHTGLFMDGNADITMGTGNIDLNSNSIINGFSITSQSFTSNTVGAGNPIYYLSVLGTNKGYIRYHASNNRIDIGADSTSLLLDGTHDAIRISGVTRDVRIINDLEVAVTLRLESTTNNTTENGYILVRNMGGSNDVEHLTIGNKLTTASGALNLAETYAKISATPPVANQIAFWEDASTIKGDPLMFWATNKLQVHDGAGDGFSYLAGLEVTTISSTLGDSVFHSVEKTATSGAGSAYFNAYVDPAVSGDAFIRFGVLNTRYYVLGIDNTDDVFRIDTGITSGTLLTTTPLLSLDSSGNLTLKTSAIFTTGQFKFSGSTIDFLDDLDSHLIKTADTFTFQTGASTRLIVDNTGITTTGITMSGVGDITLDSGDLNMNGRDIINLQSLTAGNFTSSTTGVVNPIYYFVNGGATKGFIRYHSTNNRIDIGADSTGVLLDGTHDAIRISGANRDVTIQQNLIVATRLFLNTTDNWSTGTAYLLVRNLTNDEVEHVTIGTNLSISGGALNASGGGNVSSSGSTLANRIAYFTDDTTITGHANLTWNLDKLQNAGTNVTTYMEGGRFLVSASGAGINAIFRAVSTSATGGYSALELVNANGGGDPQVLWAISDASNYNYSAGIDNTDDVFKFRSAQNPTTSTPSTGTLVWQVASGGNRLMANNLGIITAPATADSADSILLWDSGGDVTRLTIGSGLSVVGGALTVPAGNVTTSGTPANTYVSYFTGASTITGSANFTYNGTTLDVTQSGSASSTLIAENTNGAGTSFITGAVIASFLGNLNGLRIRNTTSSDYFLYNDGLNNGIAFNADTAGIQFVYNASSVGAFTSLGFNVNVNTASDLFVEASTGWVGIGNVTPARNLHIHDSTDTSVYMQFTHSTSGTAGTNGMLVGFDSSLSYVFTYANIPLVFGTNATEKMRIATSGKVGIGDTSATYGLTLGAGLGALSLGNVESNTADLSTSATINANYLIRGFNGWWGLRQYSTGVGSDHTLSFDVYNAGSELSGLAIMQSGDVGVNFTSTNDLGGYTAPSLSVIGTSAAISSIQVGATIADYEGAYGDFVIVHGNTTAPEKRLAIIRGETGGATANNRGGRLRFYTKQNNSSTMSQALVINEYAQTTSESTLGIPFWVGRPSGTDGRYIVLYDTVVRGYLGADSTYSFQVYDSTNTISTLAVTNSATNPGVVTNGSATGSPYFSFRQAGTERAYIQYSDGNDKLMYYGSIAGHEFHTTASHVMDFNTTTTAFSPYISWSYQGTRRGYMQSIYNGHMRVASEYGGFEWYTGSGGSASLRFLMDGSGNFHADANITGYSTSVSDRRLKENIVNIDSKQALSSVLKMRGVNFQWKHKDDGRHYGFIAQEMAKIYSDVVVKMELPNLDGVYNTIRDTELIPILAEAIKEQNKQIEELKTTIKQLTK